ncbi:hypothetical protein [Nocardia alba]|uniref:Uncharacterized protein n=1 Tax=Nocardia alba TaxID=225051 RepID=A0A4R1FPT3_9NOCA|nr:hypothetical protein [Nocardia alba]TCJ97176.1 hypothetical protein DFR71_3212 [Nocardia alba]
MTDTPLRRRLIHFEPDVGSLKPYGNGAYSRLLDNKNPYSWKCWR